MATTTYDFEPSSVQNFQFQPELDGSTYNIIVTWNLFGQRYYINIYSLGGTWILTIPMIGSPIGSNISLTAGYFDTQLVWRIDNNQFEVID